MTHADATGEPSAGSLTGEALTHCPTSVPCEGNRTATAAIACLSSDTSAPAALSTATVLMIKTFGEAFAT
jgi:hypothetical protein